MAKSNNPENEGMSLLVKKAKEDSKFFHDLIWNTEKVLSSLDFLSRSEKAAILSIKPEDLIVGLAGGNVAEECGGTCGASCGASCGATCGGSCGGSCTATCAASCAVTGAVVENGDDVINPSQSLSADELSSQIVKAIGENFSRFKR